MFLRQPEVLIIDAQRDLSAVLMPHLQSLSMGLMVALSVRAGQRQANEGLPDLIFLNWTTDEAAAGSRLLRQNPATAHIPIIALLVAPTPAERSRAMADGAITSLDLPLDLKAVSAAIFSHIALQLRLSGTNAWQRSACVMSVTQAIAELQIAERQGGHALAVQCQKQLAVGALQAVFVEHLGMSIAAFANRLCLVHANERLRSSGLSVDAIAQAAGYSDPDAFAAAYRACFGIDLADAPRIPT